jgi:tetratricopeptide (TPR) repeat protein
MRDADELYERTTARYGKDNIYFTEAAVLRANLLQMTNRSNEAVPLLEQALPNMRKYVGKESPNVVAVLTHLAEAYQATGRTPQSEQALTAAQQIADHDPGNGHMTDLLRKAHERIDALKAGRTLRCGES